MRDGCGFRMPPPPDRPLAIQSFLPIAYSIPSQSLVQKPVKPHFDHARVRLFACSIVSRVVPFWGINHGASEFEFRWNHAAVEADRARRLAAVGQKLARGAILFKIRGDRTSSPRIPVRFR